MTQVFFYHGASDKVATACALLSGAYAKRRPVLVYAPDKRLAQSVDRMLWLHPALSFTPHCELNSPLAAETPILIADTLTTVPQTERLMNLSLTLPPGFERFQSLVEVVSQEEEDRLAARDRVKLYKESGCEVRYFDLSQR